MVLREDTTLPSIVYRQLLIKNKLCNLVKNTREIMESLSKEMGVVYLLDKPYKDESIDSIDLESLLTPKPKGVVLKQKEGYYNVGWSNQLHRIISKKSISADEVARFKAISKADLLLDVNWMLCGHQPAYAIELFSDDLLYFKTSFCFDCDTWINEVQGEFIRLHLNNTKLLDWLNSIIPLPK